MTPTVTYINKKFDEFNRLIFSGRLPALPIEISDAGGYLGKCVFQQHRRPDGLMEYSDFRLRFNSRIDLPENVLEDTIIHEMIHYLILWTGLHDSSPHGDIFKAIMAGINAAHGRNITIRHKYTDREAKDAVSTKHKWHVIAVLYLKSGKTGVKVLPRTATKILDYYRVATAQTDVVSVGLYLHNNPFFNRYPTSAAHRFHDIDPSLLQSNLTGAHRLKVTGNQILGDTTN